MRPKTFHFARHGITAQRDDVETTTNVDQPKARPPPSLQQQQTKTSLQQQQTKTLPSKQPTQPHPPSQNQQLPAKAISVHSKKLYFVATRFQSGFERTLVGKTLEQIRYVVKYFKAISGYLKYSKECSWIFIHMKHFFLLNQRFCQFLNVRTNNLHLNISRPVLFYTMDTELSYDMPIKELQFAGYQIFR